MSAITDHLSGELCFMVLGSIGDRPRRLPPDLRKHVRGFFLDAVNADVQGDAIRAEQIDNIVAPDEGPVTLTQRRWVQCSSVARPLDKIVTEFGLGDYTAAVSEIQAEAITLTGLSNRFGVTFDFIKTDIEGLDGPVIYSAGELLDHALVVTMELRFLPYYEGEPHFDEVVCFMREHGFEVLRVDVEHWRYKTTHRKQFFDGRSVHADTIFVRAPELIAAEELHALERFMRQVLILTMIGRPSYAEYILEAYLNDAPPALRAELAALIVANARQDSGLLARRSGLAELHKLYRTIRSRAGRLLRAAGLRKDKNGFKFEHVGS